MGIFETSILSKTPIQRLYFPFAFSLENAYISMCEGLPSTLIRWAFSSKTHWFENGLESGTKRKRIHVVLMWMVENGRKQIKMKTMTENIAVASVCSVRVDFNLRHNVQFNRFRTFYWGQSKTHQNSSEDANRWQRKRILLKTHLFQKGPSLPSLNFHDVNSPLVIFIVTPHYISLTLLLCLLL